MKQYDCYMAATKNGIDKRNDNLVKATGTKMLIYCNGNGDTSVVMAMKVNKAMAMLQLQWQHQRQCGNCNSSRKASAVRATAMGM